MDSDLEVIQYWGNTLWHVDDLYNMDATLYTDWMKNNEGMEVRPLLERNEGLPKGSTYKQGAQFMPTLQDLGLEEVDSSKAVYRWCGGETKALQRLEEYLKDGIQNYKKERNGFVGENYSSKLSPWLANGCLSIKKVYHRVLEWQKEEPETRSVDHFVKHLFVRDFWKYWALHFGPKIFHQYGSIN